MTPVARTMRPLCAAALLAACGASRAPSSAPPSAATPVVIASPSPSASPATVEPTESAPPPTTTTHAAPPPLNRERLPRSLSRHKPIEYVRGGVEALEKLLAATPETSVDYPTILRKIAIDRFELHVIERELDPARAADSLLRAEQMFARVPASAFPPSAETRYVSGLVHEQRGHFVAARDAYASAIAAEHAPAEIVARAHYGIALLAERDSRRAEAERAYERARETLFRLGVERDEDRALRETIDERLKALRR